jgi:uncharacterized membrane protein
LRHDLYYIVGLSLVLAGIIALGNGWWQGLRVALGLPFILFFPGYVLIAALFTRKEDLSGIERVALSFGLSIAVVPLIGLGLNYTPWGIRLAPILVSLIVFIFAMTAIAWYRRRRLPADDAFIPTFDFELPVLAELSRLDRVLSVLLIVSILVAIGSIIYVVTMPKTGEKFTEFYILGPGGKAEGYPGNLAVGQQGQVIVGVVNHEYSLVNYTVQVKIGDTVQSTIGPIALSNEQKWENPAVFSVSAPQQNLQVQFLLFRQGDTTPYRSLHLWVNVHGASAVTLSPSALAPATTGRPYQVTFGATGGTWPYTFKLAGALPAGMIMSGAILSGRPSLAGHYPIIVTAADQKGLTASQSYTLTVTQSVYRRS